MYPMPLAMSCLFPGTSGVWKQLSHHKHQAKGNLSGNSSEANCLGRKLAKQISKLQSGFVYHYAFVMLIGLTIFITIIGLWDFYFFWVDNGLYFIYIVSFLFIHFKRDISTN